MRGVDGASGILEIMGRIAERKQSGSLLTGELLTGGKIRVGDITIEQNDYIILQHTVIINNEKVIYPSIEDHTLTITHTHPHGITPVTETITIKFPKIPVGANLLLMQLDDGVYIVFGEV